MGLTLCWRPPSEYASLEVQKIEDFRCKAIAYGGTWVAFWNAYAENVLATCDCDNAALVSIFGTSHNGHTLTVLGSWGPDAAAVYVGRVLPSPWGRLGPTTRCSKTGTNAPAAPQRQMLGDMPGALTWKSGSQPSLPYEWHQLLGQTRFAETLSLQAQLEPLLLGGRLVGALLVVTYAGGTPHGRTMREALTASTAAPFTSPVTWTGGEGGEGAPAPASAAASFLRRLKKRSPGGAALPASAPSPGLMRGLAVALSQAAFGPNLQAVTRICSASQSLATAATLHDLTSVLSAAISEALAAELHVNLAVRVAVVPPLHGLYGYLLPLEPAVPALGGSGQAHLNVDTPVKRAISSIQLSCAASSTRALRATGRAGSFSGQAPASGSNAIFSAPGGLLANAVDVPRAAPFALPSSLLLQLLRGSGRPGQGSVHAGGGGGVNILLASSGYHPEEPTVRGFVSEAAAAAPGGAAAAKAATVSAKPPPPPLGSRKMSGLPQADGCTAGLAAARDSAPLARRTGVSAHGGDAAPRGGAGASWVSGMVVSNLNAWMQDVERPSSDVTLLMMAAMGRGAGAGSTTGRPSIGGAGGGSGALGGGPACLVAVAGSAAPRLGALAAAAAAAAAAASGSVHAPASCKAGNQADDPWFSSLDVSQRRGVAAEASTHRGGYGNGYGNGCANGYGGGSVRYDGGVSCGPCVALYITAQERLPTSLLRAVKDRATALLELLLPACLSSLTMGPVRSEVDLLAAYSGAAALASAAASVGGNGSSVRRLLAATASVHGAGNHAAAAATPSVSASATPLPSTHISGSQMQLSQLQMQLQVAAGRASVGSSSPRKGAPSGDEAAAAAVMAPSLRSPMRGAAGAPAGAGTASLSGGISHVLPAAGAAQRKSLREGGGGGRRGSDGEDGHLIPVVIGSSREICLIAQQRWPEASGPGANGVVTGPGLGTSPCCALPTMPTAPPSSQSRTTRGSPMSYGFGAGGEECGMLASMDVTGAMDDMVVSMRDNLDVWVNSFWEMLRDAPAKAGHTHGSYADDDLRFLRLYQRLGSGGAASVYAGVLLGMDVAVKVIEPPPEVDMEALASVRPRGASASGENGGPVGESDSEEAEGERLASLAAAVRQAQMRELIRSARECAVLTTLSHPAIVQVYSYHTRVRVVPGDGPDGLPRLVPVPPGEGGEAQGPLHSVLVMERCDLGSLADALDNGMFKKAIIAAANAAPVPAPAARSAGGRALNPPYGGASGGGFSFSSSSSGGSAMRAIYLTLLEVALALRHLHSLNLVHCDVKVANVLLKSSASDPRGFTCKLSDFGLVNLLRDEEADAEEQQAAEGQKQQQQGEGAGAVPAAVAVTDRKPCIRNADAAGTVTHLAPECFEPGAKLDQSVDVYAFGIVMWEVLTRKPPYAEFAPEFEGLAARVLEGLRPRFPSHCPPAYRALAQACWCRDAARRPTAASVVNCLQQMLEG